MKLHYKEHGTGYPFILLHGNGESSEYFVHQIEYFSKEYRVIAIDTRGHGESPRGKKPFTIGQFAEDLYYFMKEHSICKANILGFSDGGNIALTFAQKHPDKVNKLILNGANLNPKGVRKRVQIPIVLGYRFTSMFAKKSANAKKNAEMLGLMVNEPNINPKELAALDMPTLVIVGTNDMIKDTHSKMICDSLASGKLVRIKGDHFIANKNFVPFNLSVKQFLDK